MYKLSKDSTRRTEAAKTRVLSSGDSQDEDVREQILESWRRSKFWGVSSDRLEPPYSEQVELENRLVGAAKVVMDRLEATLSGTAMSIILTNGRGQVLQRRTGEESLKRQLDSICLAPGFSYAEEHVGTNGIGSAIECRRPFFVAGAEHFSHSLAEVSCAGAPILHPLTGRLQGIIDLTCRAGDATPLMKVLAEEAAAEITRLLLEQSSTRERALLAEFLAASHNSNRAVVAVSGDLVISNALAAGLLDRADHVLLKDRAADLVGCSDSVADILLSSGDTAHLKARTVGDTSASSGVVVELIMADRREDGPASTSSTPVRPAAAVLARPGAPVEGLAGRSGSWAVTRERVDSCGRDGSRLLMVGEVGSGKVALLRAAHRRWSGAGALKVIDASQLSVDATAVEEVLARLLDPDVGTVVLRNIDSLPDTTWAVIDDWIEGRGDGRSPWITGTVRTSEKGPDLGELTRPFAAVVAVPALRHRIEDVRDLVPVLLSRLAPGREVTVGSDAMQVLLRYPWPGNVAELDEVLQGALLRRPRGRITSEDLPEMVHSTRRQVLSPWESMERDMVTRALIEAKGDKAQAATQLGISRATIYRKLRTYGIILSGFERAK